MVPHWRINGMRSLFIALIMTQIILVYDVNAEIYRCVDKNGKVTYTTTPGPGCKLLPESIDPKNKNTETPIPNKPKKPSRDISPMICTTNEGYVACIKEEWLDDMTAFVNQGDKDSFKTYIELKRCVIMNGNLRVTVTDWPGMFGGKTEFIYQGVKFWTYREGINYGQ